VHGANLNLMQSGESTCMLRYDFSINPEPDSASEEVNVHGANLNLMQSGESTCILAPASSPANGIPGHL